MHVLSLELFGTSLALPSFPRVKNFRGIGTSDTAQYAAMLAEKFDYRNTFYDHAPQFDIADPPDRELGIYDFVVSSEIFEHVPPPVESSFSNALCLLKPNGVLLFTIPYSIEDRSLEHFPDLYQYTTARLGDSSVLINRTRDGLIQVFENLVFHLGSGASLEMREMNEKDLMAMLAKVGFSEIYVHSENFDPFGIWYAESWSLPIAARRGPYALNLQAAREILDQFDELRTEVLLLREKLDVGSTRQATFKQLRQSIDRWSRRRGAGD